MKTVMEAWEAFDSVHGEHCIECHCATGDEWEFKDFTCKTIVICPQCKTEYNVEAA